MNMTSQNNENHQKHIENNKNCQTFVYYADEISLQALLDPNFRPMTKYEQQQQQQPQPQLKQVYYENPHRPQRSLSTAVQPVPYDRASFDPYADLPPYSTIPTRRRHLPPPVTNNTSIIHL